MIGFAKTMYKYEIDINTQQYESNDGIIDGIIIEILKEIESVIDLSDTNATLDDAETDLKVFYEYFEIASDGFLVALTAPNDFIDERTYLFASTQLLKEDDLTDCRNELQEIKNEVLASYGQIFDLRTVQYSKPKRI